MITKNRLTLRNSGISILTNKLVILGLILLFLGVNNSWAQQQEDHPEYKYLLKNNPDEKLRFSTFYGELAPTTAWANLSSSFGKVFMAEFGLHLNRKFALGFYLARSPKKNQVLIPATGSPEYNDWINAGIELDQLPPGSEVAFVYFSHSGVNLSYMHKRERTVSGGLDLDLAVAN